MRIGDTVHYRSYGTPGGEYQGECRAAIITGTYPAFPSRYDLAVLNPTGLFLNQQVKPGGPTIGGTWHSRDACSS